MSSDSDSEATPREGATEELDDALGGVIARKTSVLNRRAAKNAKRLRDHSDALERLQKQVGECIEREAYLREVERLRADAREALNLAREVRSDQTAQGALLRDEVMRSMRDELASGLSAQHSLSTSQAKSIADLHTSATETQGRLSAAEMALSSSATRNAASEVSTRLTEHMAAASARMETLGREVSEAKAAPPSSSASSKSLATRASR